MSKTQTSNNIIKKTKQWLNNISQPKRKLGGNAICPSLAQFMAQTQVVYSTDPHSVVETFAQLKNLLHLEAVVIVGDTWDYDWQLECVTQWNKKYKSQDVYCLMMNPNTCEPPLPLEYTFERPLFVVQRLSTLKHARKNTAKNTNYYTFYNN